MSMKLTYKKYIELISREPLPEMIEQGNGYRYIKKSVLKRELLNIYNGNTKFEMIKDTVTKNGLWGSGLLHFKHPVSGEWLFEAGFASIPHDRVMRLNFPNLKSHCFRNSCREIGPWFGMNLNLEEDKEPEEIPEINIENERWEKLIDDCKTMEELAAYKIKLPKELMAAYMNKLKFLTNNIKSNEF